MKTENIKHAIVSTDVVLFCVSEGKLKIVLSQVKNEEYKGQLAFPGGLIRSEENSLEAAKRVIREKLKLNPENIYLEELGSYSEVNRDIRGRVVSIAYIGLIEAPNISDLNLEICQPQDLKKIKSLAYDHNQILKDATLRLKNRFSNSTIANKLLSKYFTMTEFYNLYNLVLDKNIDKRNFAKKIIALDIVKESGKLLTGQKNRPAKLMEFKKEKVVDLEIF
jgi:8-oxo-dGTP diphosphatase